MVWSVAGRKQQGRSKANTYCARTHNDLHPQPKPASIKQNRLDFFLDPDSTQYRSILEMAEGFWYIDDRPADRPPGWTRVYMSATVKVNSLVPLWLVEYAAERALKRASSWLKPWVEQRAWEKEEQKQ